MYKYKYLKYKNKYLQLMNQIGGKTNCNLTTFTQSNNNYNLNCTFSQPIDKSIIQKNDNNIKCDCTSLDNINWNCNCNKIILKNNNYENKCNKRQTVLEVYNKLKSFDWDNFNTIPTKNKGARGQLLEIVLGIPNSSSLLDCIDGELKTFTVGESIACTQLTHCLPDIVNETPFESTKLGIKMKNIIYVAFTRNNIFNGVYVLNKLNNKLHYTHLEEDYNYISQKINDAIKQKTTLYTINGPNKLLQIRTKASKNSNGLYTPLVFRKHQLKDKYMAFYLTADFGKKLCKK